MPPSRPGTGRRLLRALVSAAVLAALVAGLPWLLYATTTAVWAQGTDALAHLLTRQDTGAAFMLALCAIGWIAWASFTLSVLLEIPAQLRGRRAPSLPGLRLSQRAAGTLVSGILVLFASSTLASATPALTTTVTATATAETAHPDAAAAPAEHSAQTTGTERTAARTYTVQDARPAESLWSIAEKLYGHGELYTKIADANEGRRMADGSVFRADAPIHPGWILTLPDAPATRTDDPDAPSRQAGPAAYTVQGGDTLWKVAEEELGDGERYQELFEANRGARQPDGSRLTDPDEIQAGLTLTIPHATAPSEISDTRTPPPTSQPADEQPDADTATPPSTPIPATTAPESPARPDSAPPANTPKAPPTAAPTTRPTAPVTAAPAPSVPSQPGETAPGTGAPAPERPAASIPPAPEEATDREDADGIGIRDAAAIGMLAAGTLLATLGLKRMLQRRRRRPGELPATTATTAEQNLHATADPGSLELLDLALRALAHHATEHGLELPAVAGARITDRTVELLLPAPETDDGDITVAPAPIPFTEADPGRWTLDRTQPLLDADTAAGIPAPYPGLITLGTDPDGNHLLINLTLSRVLLLDGTPDAVRDTARVLALEAATSTWSDHSEIITVGLGDQLPPLLPKSRMRAVPHLKGARTDLAELLLEQRQTADGDDAPDRLPWTLVCAADIDEDEARMLADTLTAARDLPVALIVPAQGTSGAFGSFDEAVHLAVGTTRTQYVDALDADLVVQSLPEDDYEDFLDLLRQAEEPAQPAEGPWKQVPPRHINLAADDAATTSPTALPAAPFTAFTASQPLTSVPPLPTPATEPETTPAPEPTAIAPPPPQAPERSGTGEPDEDESSTEEPADTADLHAPEIQILGPITVTGIASTGHGPKLALLAAYLYFKPSSPDAVREAMDPRSPWTKPTLQTRISQLRNQLGTDQDDALYLPRDRTGIYKLSPRVRCDWDRFTTLAERGLTKGPSTGISDLEAAIALVRGCPFGNTPPAWAAARVQEILVRITDTAHTLATWHRTGPRPDLDAARRAVRRGLDIDDSAELLYQDWMLIEDQAGNHNGVRAAYETILTINRRLDVSTEPDTDAIYERLTNRTA
ncbi:LysM peptidoglycan-binding domain-containing protein [Streptomyces sp. WAC01280]|uniref:LysM peptidoglycan-binding domain-containing protein n=1 Tax=Streptomyces sp. WAC01280 TaxID=2487424 RepID=UPI000F7A48F9|nr:LysM peptidoglycan-binding domain-containing protein [Streptomyces sp. WAC01280]RSS57503.1 LysM peptidoglycan-binding domain-containing protein [Streptomyces sp. WAC01280]